MKKILLCAFTAATLMFSFEAEGMDIMTGLDSGYVTSHTKDSVFTFRTDKEIVVTENILAPGIKLDIQGRSFICQEHCVTAGEMIISVLGAFVAANSTLTSTVGSIAISAKEDAVMIGNMDALGDIITDTRNFCLTGIISTQGDVRLTAVDNVIFKGGQVKCKKCHIKAKKFIEL